MTRAEPLAYALREFPCRLVIPGPGRRRVLARDGGGTDLSWFEVTQPSSIS
jgi:hypothetical protein